MGERIVAGALAATVIGGVIIGCSAITSFDNFVGEGEGSTSASSSGSTSSGSASSSGSTSTSTSSGTPGGDGSTTTSSSGTTTSSSGGSDDSGTDAPAGPCTIKTTPAMTATAVTQNGGDAMWSDLDNARLNDGLFANVGMSTPSPEQSRFLRLTGFNFGMPADADLRGIRARIRWKASGSEVRDEDIRLLLNGQFIGLSRARSDDVPVTVTDALYGGLSDKWSDSLTATQANDTTFGIAIMFEYHGSSAATGSIDSVTLEATYCSTP